MPFCCPLPCPLPFLLGVHSVHFVRFCPLSLRRFSCPHNAADASAFSRCQPPPAAPLYLLQKPQLLGNLVFHRQITLFRLGQFLLFSQSNHPFCSFPSTQYAHFPPKHVFCAQTNDSLKNTIFFREFIWQNSYLVLDYETNTYFSKVEVRFSRVSGQMS